MASCTIDNLSYDCVQDCISNKNNNNTTLKIFQWNIRGMNRLDKFDCIKEFLDRYESTIDVLIICETWVKNGCTSPYSIDGYNAIFSSRESSHGGLAVYIRKTLTYQLILSEVEHDCHYICIKLKHLGKTIDLLAIYRPPSFPFEAFMIKIDAILSNGSNAHKIIAGDMNIPMNSQTNNAVKEYSRLLASFDLKVTNTIATRPSSSNILDHFICSSSIAPTIINETICTDISDHSMLLSSLGWQAERQPVVLKKAIVDHRRLNTMFSQVLENLPRNLTANQKLSYITDKFNEIKNSVTRTVTVEARIKGHCPWMSFELWHLMAIKDKLLKRKKKNPNDLQTAELLNHVSKKLQSKKTLCKRNYYHRLLSSGNTKQSWKCINELIGKNSNRSKSVELNVNGVHLTDNSQISNEFNTYFCSIGEKLASTITSDKNITKFDTLPSVSSTMYLRTTSMQEIILLINSLDCSKAPGPDNITAAIMKTHHLAFSRILMDVFNEIIVTGEYPECLKTARVTPVFKAGDPTDIGNYRPISTLSVMNKIIEQLLASRISGFLGSRGLLYTHQYGFRRGSSTLTSTSELLDDIYSDIDRSRFSGALFLDLKKAFDVINHELLLKKLVFYGIRGLAHNLIGSYLFQRSQFVSVNGTNSDHQTISTGVPQGSVLGPLLFLIYINDISGLQLRGKVRLFADDTVVTYSSRDCTSITQHIQDDLHVLDEYFTSNLLFLNLRKTVYMVFHSMRRPIPALPVVQTNNTVIHKVESFKYLGLVLDDTISWEAHIDHLKKKIAPLCGILRKI